ncbi:MAG: NAD(P)-binding domain-containing protein [Hyphomicrobiaceae bacterium]|nr:NAD(P)-binding domain-containing protein [Hyphomicrobiaceae bacterium]MCC0023292.1 NAD(P)-binding domain-containing protein [Hyphomicrobiaceae bacterium]
MKISILGTGMVGRTIAQKLLSLGHDIVMGTRDPAETLTRNEPDNWGNPGFADWHKANSAIKLVPFGETADGADLVINALSGHGTLVGLEAVGAENLAGKILIDISNPLDFSNGFPPSLFVSNTDSLGEQVQRALPETRVVKTLNTVNANLMVEPKALADGDHSMCVAGNDETAKAEVAEFLKEQFGWTDVIDLGDITTARGTEAVLLWWVRLWGSLQNPMFAFKIVR